MSTVEWHKDDQDEGKRVIFITLEQDARCVQVRRRRRRPRRSLGQKLPVHTRAVCALVM